MHMLNVFSTKRSFARTISSAARVFQVTPLAGQRILAFHSIGNTVDGDVNNIYSLSRTEFVKQIDSVRQFAEDHGFSFAPFGTPKEQTICITFDDGYSDALSVAAPILSNFRIPFHVFVSPQKSETNDARYLSKAEIKELHSISQATVGAHGYSHTSLTSISNELAKIELDKSKSVLEDLLSSPVESMSYPYGHTNEHITQMTQQSGFKYAACSKWGFVAEKSNPLMQSRIDMWTGDTQRDVQLKLYGSWNWFHRFT
jgi:peptidoglycan/xylan/chitin deacetylase (PgdA/CDA1 family)